jgi:predicted MFS family arabinose efflux permease
MSSGPIAKAGDALRHADFRRLFWIRLASQFADGLFQASLIASVVFSPSKQSTTVGLLRATLIVSLPFSIIGPFTGVFIDRWRRRRILTIAPWLRAAFVGLVLFDPSHAAFAFYAGALVVLSANRFFLSTAQAVVPRLVPTEDLLTANSLATVGGTVALLGGVFAGGRISQASGNVPLIVASIVLWLLTSLIASRIRSDLAPLTVPEDPGRLRHEVRRVAAEFADGVKRLVGAPRALGPITSITLDQIGEGIVLTLSLVVFRDRFKEGVGSFSTLIGAGGVGVFVGLTTVGLLERRFSKQRIVAGSFLASGLVLLGVSLHITGWSVLLASFATGLTFAWKKVPIDTLVQESLPDGYRGRVFAVYDVAYNLARVVAAAVAVPLFPALGDARTVALVGLVFVLWTPVLPRWIGRRAEILLRFVEGAAAPGSPRAIVWGGVEEDVEVLLSGREDREGSPMETFRLRLRDGTILDVARRPDEDAWHLEAELPQADT